MVNLSMRILRYMRELYLLLLSLCLLAFASVVAWGDDAPLDMSGGCASLLKGDHTSVRMVRATVTITLQRDGYTVDAVFVFVNDGDATTQLVGFPNTGYGLYGYGGGFQGAQPLHDFETWVDGKAVPFKDVDGAVTASRWLDDDDGYGGYEEVPARNEDEMQELKKDILSGRLGKGIWEERRWYAKEVAFPAHGSVTTRVRYGAAYWNGFPLVAEYCYGTGGAWKGTIGTLEFVLVGSSDAYLLDVPDFSRRAGLAVTTREPRIERVDGATVKLTLDQVETGPEEVIRVYADTGRFPASYFYEEVDGEKEFSEELLRVLGSRQLLVLRNHMLAKKGKVFEDAVWRDYFAEEDWYKPNPEFKLDMLNDIQRRNLKALDDALFLRGDGGPGEE